jgi:hypothetical protein
MVVSHCIRIAYVYMPLISLGHLANELLFRRDCTACGFINRDPAIRNVVWDRNNQKWYFHSPDLVDSLIWLY